MTGPPWCSGFSSTGTFLPQALRTLSYCMLMKWRLWNAVHVFILALTEHLLTQDQLFLVLSAHYYGYRGIYSISGQYLLACSHSLWAEKKKKFSRAKLAFYSVNMVIFAWAKFLPLPFPFMFGVLLFGKDLSIQLFLCRWNYAFST